MRIETGPKPLHEILFWNPWSTIDFLAELSGRSARAVKNHLDADEGVEILNAPSEFGRRRSAVYALARSQQIRLFGRNIKPAFMAEALMMGFSRLRKGRDIVRVLHHNGLRVPWVISPWRPFRNGSLFDALLLVENMAGERMLVAVVGRHEDINFIGVEHLVKVWGKWRQKKPHLPATLLFWEPRFNLGEAKRLSPLCRNENGDVVCFYPFSDLAKRWVYLNARKFDPVAVPLWERGLSSSLEALDIAEFHPNIRIQRYPHAETLQKWLAEERGEESRLAADFFDLTNRDIEMFRWLLLYPALSRQTFVALAGNRVGGGGESQNSLRRAFNQRLRKLITYGYATEIEQFPGHYGLTPIGLQFFSMLSGIDPEMMSRSWGYPEQIGKFSFQQKHQIRIWKFIREIARDGVLVRAGTESNRLIFYDIHRVSVKIPKIEIRPDVIITVRVDKAKLQTFWVEIDRGTRRGEKIRWKLEKFFHIFYAHKNPSLIEPVLYIVDCENGQNESRARYIFKLLQRLYGSFPQTPLRVLITSADLLDRVGGRFLDQTIWREFYLGRVDKKLRSLGDIFQG